MLAPPAIFIMRPPHYLYALMLAMYSVMAAAPAAVWEMSEDYFSDTPRDKTTLIIDLYSYSINYTSLTSSPRHILLTLENFT